MKDAVIIGLGQLGQLYGAAFLRMGFRVTPVARSTPRPLGLGVAPGTPVLLAVGEEQFDDAVDDAVKAGHGHDLLLLQNEIFPACWRAHGVMDPTVMLVWTNRKKGVPLVGAPTRVFGPRSALVMDLHAALDIPCETLATRAAFQTELCAKYAFIVAVNALGCAEARTLAEWMAVEPQRVAAVLRDAVALASARVDAPPDAPVDTHRATQHAHEAMVALGSIPTRGRTAEPRMHRAAAAARMHRVDVPALRDLLPAIFASA